MPTLLQSWLQNHAEYEAKGRKLAFIVGPGGNAGVISAGLLAAMVQTGSVLPNAHYIGISVGAYNLLYLLANQNHHAATIFGRFYCDNRFINPLRLLNHRPVLNLDYVLNEITEHTVPLDYSTAATSPLRISALTTNGNGEALLLPLTGTPKQQVQHALRATSSMPYMGRTQNLHTLSEWDGWLIEHTLLPHLKQQGVTDVIWCLNRPLEEPDTMLSRLLWKYIRHQFKTTNPRMRQLIKDRTLQGDFLTTPHGLRLEVHYPHTNIPANCRSSPQLFHALGHSYRTMATYLGHPHLAYPTEWAPWQHHMPR